LSDLLREQARPHARPPSTELHDCECHETGVGRSATAQLSGRVENPLPLLLEPHFGGRGEPLQQRQRREDHQQRASQARSHRAVVDPGGRQDRCPGGFYRLDRGGCYEVGNGPGQNRGVKPVGFRYNPGLGTIDVTGFNMAASQKLRNVRRNGSAALVIDDVASADPWRVRFLEIRGTADAVQGAQRSAGPSDEALIRIHPTRIPSFGIEEPLREPHLTRLRTRDLTEPRGST
jgi:pyridoxamine 5'-phosphate oxidase family protein